MFNLNTLITLATSLFKIDGTLFPPQAQLTNNTSYDFVIIGGGTAGCVVAARLVEQNCSVLVLEAGDLPNIFAMAPGLFFLEPKTSLDYDFKSTYNPYAASAQGNRTRLTAGKVLGGSSALNHHLYVRGPPVDYDTWADVTGDDSWKYDNLLPFFKKSESMKDQQILEAYGEYHGTDGPTGVSRLVSNEKFPLAYLKAQAEAGNPTVEDINSNTNTGYTQPEYTIARDRQNKTGGIRQMTSYSYFYDIKDSPYLHVSRNTLVKRIIFEDKTAVGVEAEFNGKTYIFKANKEVILSAGTFNSPQILQLSGIGPKEHLESLGIDVKVDLPVGDNLRIPPAVVIVTKAQKHSSVLNLGGRFNLDGILPALDITKLPFPVILGSGALNKSSNVPNHQSYNLMIPYGTPFELLACPAIYGYNTDICVKWQKETQRYDAVFSVLVNLEAESTGTVRLNSTNASYHPIITTGFYDNADDLDKFVTIMLDFTSFVKSPTFAKMDAELVGLDLAECSAHEKGCREFWKCYMLHRTISPFLYSGTCPMGSVVDGDLYVKGLSSLRVVDASVFPRPMHGAINAAVLALAEKTAAQIIAKYGCSGKDTA